MVLAPSLYKTGRGLAAADEQLRFSLGAFHQPLCCHPTRDKELRLSSRQAHKTAGDEGWMKINLLVEGRLSFRPLGKDFLSCYSMAMQL